MAVALRNAAAATSNGANVASATPAAPTRATGDLLLVLVMWDSLSFAANSADITASAGWTAAPDPADQASGEPQTAMLFWKEAASSAEAMPLITFSGHVTGNSGHSFIIQASSWTGADTTAPFGTSGAQASINSPNTTHVTVASPGSVAAGDAVIGVETRSSSGCTFTVPANWTALLATTNNTAGADNSGAAAYRVMGSTADPGSLVYTGTLASTYGLGRMWQIERAVAGNALTAFPADTLSLADAESDIQGFGQTVTPGDTLSLADAESDIQGFGKTVTPGDTMILADAPATQSGKESNPVDTATLADSPSSLTAFSRSPGDTLSLADAPVAEAAYARTLGDTATLADSVAAGLFFARSPADTLALADAIALGRGVSQDDSLAVADAASLIAAVARTLADSATPTDSATSSKGVSIPPADTLTLADSVSSVRGRAVLPSDTMALADAATLGRSVAVADVLAVLDLVIAGGAAPYIHMRPPLTADDTNTLTGEETVLLLAGVILDAVTSGDEGYSASGTVEDATTSGEVVEVTADGVES